MTSSLPPIDASAWIGREIHSHDELRIAWVSAIEATLDLGGAALRQGDPLPPGWHWTFFHPAEPLSALGPDGHPKPGAFLPTIEHARRMWAGGRLQIRAPLRTGERVDRHSIIHSVSEKTGASGKLHFVTVRHHLTQASGGDLVEDQDIVYRSASSTTAFVRRSSPLPEACQQPDVTRAIQPSAVQLFRYSALTFNAHRIHYDADYARSQEGYPGVVVHGPLVATFLLELFRQHYARRVLRDFTYRAHNPLILGETLTMCARLVDDHVHLWATGSTGDTIMLADAHV
jgi:3-methylfumaryl-CoA hydratase